MKNNELTIKLKGKKWRYFEYGDIFVVKKGQRLTLYDQEKGNIPYVSSSSVNNGIDNYISNGYTDENCLSFACYGSIGYVFYHPYKAWVSDNCNVFYIKGKKLNEHIAMFLIPILQLERFRFSYGMTAKAQRLRKFKIKLPVKNNNDIDWDFVENFIKDVKNTIKEPNSDSILKNKTKLEIKGWGKFELNELFKIKGSKTTPLLELKEYGKGKFPYVTTQATNNGVDGFFNFYSEGGNILTTDSAVLGYCSYQSLPFSASDHVEKLIPKFKMNKYIAMFLTTILNLEQYRYNYGRKCSQERMKKISIKLPSKNGNPDFEYMESYIKSLPYSTSL